MRVQRGKKTVEMNREELHAASADYAGVLLDIGTGDGKFVYRGAVEHPDTFCIGLDAIGENMREVSGKATRKAARGGVPNALFIVESVESLPGELRGLADTITIN
ncbi:MAG: class I SAM-dependent methyltransferase, partial [Blastocatellia bacterium]